MVINMVGLCCSGKTTLARKLSKHYLLPILIIGKLRKEAKRYKKTKKRKDGWIPFEQEINAWVKFFVVAAQLRWDDFIICTSGLNKRLDFLLDSTLSAPINIKLVCSRKELEKRLCCRKRQPPKWAYGIEGYKDFNDTLKKAIREKSADIVIDTGRLDKEKTFRKAVREIDKKRIFYEKRRQTTI